MQTSHLLSDPWNHQRLDKEGPSCWSYRLARGISYFNIIVAGDAMAGELWMDTQAIFIGRCVSKRTRLQERRTLEIGGSSGDSVRDSVGFGCESGGTVRARCFDGAEHDKWGEGEFGSRFSYFVRPVLLCGVGSGLRE